MGFRARTAVVADCGNAIGRACAVELARRGATVVALASKQAASEEVLRAVRFSGGVAVGFAGPLIDPDWLTSVREQLVAEGHRIGILVNCHQVIHFGSICETTLGTWQDSLTHNVLGPVATLQAFLPVLRATGGGAVVNLGSIDGTLGNPQVASYSASKGAIGPLTHILAAELAGTGVRVNCVARAALTESGDETSSPALLRTIEETPAGRAGEPAEIAKAVAFLASDDASYVNGAVLPVDGGRSGLTPGTFSFWEADACHKGN